LFNLETTMCGCSRALFKLGDSKECRSPTKLILKPQEKPETKYSLREAG